MKNDQKTQMKGKSLELVRDHLLSGQPLCCWEAARAYGTARLPTLVSKLNREVFWPNGLNVCKISDARKKGHKLTQYKLEE